MAVCAVDCTQCVTPGGIVALCVSVLWGEDEGVVYTVPRV